MNKCGPDRCVSVTGAADVEGEQDSICSLELSEGQLEGHCDEVDINELVAGPSCLRHAQVAVEECFSAVPGTKFFCCSDGFPTCFGS